MQNKEEQQRKLNEKRSLRKKQIAQLKASNEMLEMAKETVNKHYGKGSEKANTVISQIDVAMEQNLERAESYLGAKKDEVENVQYNNLDPIEEKDYFDRLARQGKTDEQLHIKNLTEQDEIKKTSKATTTKKTKSKLAEITERLKNISSKNENTPSDINEMGDVPPEEIIEPNAVNIELEPIGYTFDDEFNSIENETVDNTKPKDHARETVITAPEKHSKPCVEQKSCKDFDPRDIPSYIQYDIIPLPSHGECYQHKKGSLPVAYLTAADENLITARNMYENGSMIDIILERKILDKSIRVADLCKGDRDAIAIWLRATAYGSEYPIVANYNGNEIESSIDLSEVKFLDFNLIGDENGWFEYKTENGDIIKFKILSSGEENELIKKNSLIEDIITRNLVVDYMNKSIGFVENTDKSDKNDVVDALNLVKNWCLDINVTPSDIETEGYSTYITDRMVAQTMSVNGDTDREFIKNYIENMRAKDAVAYRKYVNENVPGVNLNITIPIPESMGGGSFETFLSIGETIFINV